MVRQSNIELLRIISMAFVLIVHADFQALGEPNNIELLKQPLLASSKIIFESFAIVAVNSFVLISGWFGINFSWKGLSKLLFQCLFFFFGIYITLIIAGYENLSISGIMKCLMLSNNAWFVKCYLGLFIISPVLNEFIKTVNRQTFRKILIIFYTFQTIYGWVSPEVNFIQHGYSTWSFIGLYLLGRYLNIFKPKLSKYSPSIDVIIYVSLSLIIAASMFFACYVDSPLLMKMSWEYTNPVIIISSIYLLLLFSKINFQNNIINWIAASCFAVYLQHFLIWDKVVVPHIHYLSDNFNGILFLALLALSLITFYVSAIAIDKVRILIWNKLIQPFFK